MKKGWKRFLIFLAVVAVILGAVQLCVSPLARNYVNNHGEELLGRKVSVGQVKANIFTASITLSDVVVMEADARTRFLSADQFEVGIKLLPLISKRLIVKKVVLDRLVVTVLQDGEKFNFDDILEKYAPEEDESDSGMPWDVGVKRIELKNSDINYKDLLTGGVWDLKNISLVVPGFYLSGESAEAGISLDFPGGGKLATKINYQQRTSTYSIDVTLTDFSIDGFLPYLRQSIDAGSVKGLLFAQVNVTGSTLHALDFTLSGDASLRGLKITDAKRNPVLEADSVSASIYSVNPYRMEYLFRSLEIWHPSTRYQIEADSTDNFTAMMLPVAEEQQASSFSGPVGKPKVLIESFALRDGVVRFVDHTPYKTFKYDIEELSVEAADLNPDKRSTLIATALLGGKATVRFEWTGVMESMSDHDLNVELRNVDVRDFSPYTLSMFGYSFASGTLSASSHTVVRDKQLSGTTRIDVFKPELDKKEKGVKPAYKVPLKTGLYLLTDRQGRMQMDVPLMGDIDSPEFSYGKIISKAIASSLAKAVLSPAKYLSDVLGSGAPKSEYIEIDPTLSDFDSKQYAIINQIGDLLKAKPELKVVLTCFFNSETAVSDASIERLKTEYYLRNNPGKQAAYFGLTDKQAVAAIDYKAKGFTQFTDSLLRACDLPSKGDVFTRARNLYGDVARKRIEELVSERDARIRDYMVGRLGIDKKSVEVTTPAMDELARYKGRNCYAISYTLAGEAPLIDLEGMEEDEE